MSKVGTRSINRKLVRLVILAIGSAMAVVAVLGLWQEATRYLNAKRDTLLATASAFAAATGDALAVRDRRAAYMALRGIASIPAIQFADLRDASGVSVAGIGSGVRLQGDLDLSDLDGARTALGLLSTRTVSVSVAVRKDGQAIGRLILVGDISDLWSRLIGALEPVAFGSVAALAIGLTISLRLQRSIIHPLIALTRVMASIQENHDYARDVLIQSDDEIGLLAQSFRNMLREVWERDRQLVAHRDRLEQDVAERTYDLRLAKDEAEAANTAKSDFLATMSHEIRTPMNGMLVMAELLATSDLPDRQRRYAEVIARSGQSLVAIINDILDFSKIEAGKLTLENIPFSLPDLVDTVVMLFAEKANAKALDFAAYVDPVLPETITGDPVRLTQVLSNLVNNALKFTTTGHVKIVSDFWEGQLRLSVSDTGIGIPEDKVGRLFAAFSQADQSTTRQFGGTGLGLAISKRIVDAMNGSVVVNSVTGEGSIFSVLLPWAEPMPARAIAMEPRRPIVVTVSGVATAETVTCSLEAAGFEVVSAGFVALADLDADLLADAGDLVRRGRRAGAGRVVAIAAMGDPSGEEALRLGVAHELLRRPLVQSEWRDLLPRLGGGEALWAVPIAAGRNAAAPAAASVAGLSVLVVDDSAVNREVAIEALTRLGVKAEAVDSGRAALAALTARSFDLVLMDGSMPGMDGYETTRLLREREAEAGLTSILVIALTAHVVGPAAALWRPAGMDDVLYKPFTLDSLADVIGRNLKLDVRQRLDAKRLRPTSICRKATASPTNIDDLLDDETLSGLEDMAASNRDGFVRRIVALFADGASRGFIDLRSASTTRDATTIASASHKLKSMSLNVGAARLATQLAAMEEAALDDAAIPSASVIDDAEQVFHRTVVALRARFEPTQNCRAA